ncbi:MAG: hypothetical protein HY360_02560 [Verrucomicrobia bacterium]|nr:hypothetical protein [Verrucomicrobiota bacterium]
MRSPVFLVGPTAVGKSEVAVELALRLGGEIVSADSMQIYRGMDIGTAKLTMEQRRGVSHHLLDLLDVTQSWDVAKFRELAVAAIAAIQSRDARPIEKVSVQLLSYHPVRRGNVRKGVNPNGA